MQEPVYDHGAPKGPKSRVGISHGNHHKRVAILAAPGTLAGLEAEPIAVDYGIRDRKERNAAFQPSHPKRWVYNPKRKELSHEENARFCDTFALSGGKQLATDRVSGAAKRVDLLQVPGANRREKKAAVRAYREQQRKERLAVNG